MTFRGVRPEEGLRRAAGAMHGAPWLLVLLAEIQFLREQLRRNLIDRLLCELPSQLILLTLGPCRKDAIVPQM